MDQTPLHELAQKLGMKEDDLDLLEQALTHRSYLGQVSDIQSNERLEFLGDSILGLIISEYLFSKFPDKTEGELSKAKAVAVSEPVLAEAAKKLGIPPALRLSSGEDQTGGRNRSSILSDAFEAVIAALYLEKGLEVAIPMVLQALAPIIEDIEKDEHIRNYKSILQELTQGLHKKTPKYYVLSESGADHDKTYSIEVSLNGRCLGKGTGKTKKQAEQAAALSALQNPEFQAENERIIKK